MSTKRSQLNYQNIRTSKYSYIECLLKPCVSKISLDISHNLHLAFTLPSFA